MTGRIARLAVFAAMVANAWHVARVAYGWPAYFFQTSAGLGILAASVLALLFSLGAVVKVVR